MSDYLREDEVAGGVGATSNFTAGVKNPLLPLKKRAMKRKDYEDLIDELIEESYKKAWVNMGPDTWTGSGNTWLDDAERAKNQGQKGRYHASMAEYHHAEHAKKLAAGDRAGAAEHLAAKARHKKEADKHDEVFKRHPGIAAATPKYPRPSKRLGEMRDYYDVPFARKDEAKKLGMKWDPDKKAWYYSPIDHNDNPNIPFKPKYVR